MMTEPVIAFKRPPSFEPGGGVFWVKTSRLRPLRPLKNSVNRISASQVTPKAAAPIQSQRMTMFLRRRQTYMGFMLLALFPFEPQQHESRDRQHQEGQHEQQP